MVPHARAFRVGQRCSALCSLAVRRTAARRAPSTEVEGFTLG